MGKKERKPPRKLTVEKARKRLVGLGEKRPLFWLRPESTVRASGVLDEMGGDEQEQLMETLFPDKDATPVLSLDRRVDVILGRTPRPPGQAKKRFLESCGDDKDFRHYKETAYLHLAADRLMDEKMMTEFWSPMIDAVYNDKRRKPPQAPESDAPAWDDQESDEPDWGGRPSPAEEIRDIREFAGQLDTLKDEARLPGPWDPSLGDDKFLKRVERTMRSVERLEAAGRRMGEPEVVGGLLFRKEEDISKVLQAVVRQTYLDSHPEREAIKMLAFVDELKENGSIPDVHRWLNTLADNKVAGEKLRAVNTLASYLLDKKGFMALNPNELVKNSGSMPTLQSKYFRPLAQSINDRLGTDYYSEDEMLALEPRTRKKHEKEPKRKYNLTIAEKEHWFLNALTLAENLHRIDPRPGLASIFEGGDAHDRITNQKEFLEKREYLQSKGMEEEVYGERSEPIPYDIKNSSADEREYGISVMDQAANKLIELFKKNSKAVRDIQEIYLRSMSPTTGDAPFQLGSSKLWENAKGYELLGRINLNCREGLSQLDKDIDQVQQEQSEYLASDKEFDIPKAQKYSKALEKITDKYYALSAIYDVAGPWIDGRQHPNYFEDEHPQKPGQLDDAYRDERERREAQWAYANSLDPTLKSLDEAYENNEEALKPLAEKTKKFEEELAACKTAKEQQKLVTDPKNFDVMLFDHFREKHIQAITNGAQEYAYKYLHLRPQDIEEQIIDIELNAKENEKPKLRAEQERKLFDYYERVYRFLTDPHVGLKQVPFYFEKELDSITRRIESGMIAGDPPKEKEIYLSSEFAKRDPKKTPYKSGGMGECTGPHEPGAFADEALKGEGLFASQFDYVDDPGHEMIDVYEYAEKRTKKGKSLGFHQKEQPIARAYILLTETEKGLMPVIDSIELREDFLHDNGRNHSAMEAVFKEVFGKLKDAFPEQKKVLLSQKISNKPSMAGYFRNKNYDLKKHTIIKLGHEDRGYSNTFGDLKKNSHIKTGRFYEISLDKIKDTLPWAKLIPKEERKKMVKEKSLRYLKAMQREARMKRWRESQAGQALIESFDEEEDKKREKGRPRKKMKKKKKPPKQTKKS